MSNKNSKNKPEKPQPQPMQLFRDGAGKDPMPPKPPKNQIVVNSKNDNKKK